MRLKVAGLALATGNQTAGLTTLINSQSSEVRNTVIAQSGAVQTLVNSRSASTQTLIRNESTEIENLIRSETRDIQTDVDAFKTLAVKLAIERALQGGEGKELALLQLLEPLGHLRLVGDIVRETIASMGASSQTVGIAQKYLDEATQLMNAGSEKAAFRSLGKAYRAATNQ